MTEKRFVLDCDSNFEWLMQSELFLPIKDNNTDEKISLKQCYDLLNGFAYKTNELQIINKYLKKSIKRQRSSNDECSKLLDNLNDKNQHFKEALKELKEISDYQAMRIKELETKVDFYKDFQKDARELEKENEWLTNAIEIMSANKKLEDENEQLKQVLGRILLSVKREISASHKTGEIRAFINPESYDLISDVLRKYGGLKGWYDD